MALEKENLKREVRQILAEKPEWWVGSPPNEIREPAYVGLSTCKAGDTMVCPQCGRRVTIVAPPPEARVSQAFTTLRCSVCGEPLCKAPTGGWKAIPALEGKPKPSPPEEKPPEKHIMRPPPGAPYEAWLAYFRKKGYSLEEAKEMAATRARPPEEKPPEEKVPPEKPVGFQIPKWSELPKWVRIAIPVGGGGLLLAIIIAAIRK